MRALTQLLQPVQWLPTGSRMAKCNPTNQESMHALCFTMNLTSWMLASSYGCNLPSYFSTCLSSLVDGRGNWYQPSVHHYAHAAALHKDDGDPLVGNVTNCVHFGGSLRSILKRNSASLSRKQGTAQLRSKDIENLPRLILQFLQSSPELRYWT